MPGFFLDDERRPRTRWRLAIFLAALLVAQLIVGVIGFVIAAFMLDIDVTSEELLLKVQVVGTPPMLATSMVVLLLARRFLDRRSIRSLGFGRPQSGWWLGTIGALLFGVGLITLIVIVLFALQQITYVGNQADMMTAILVPTLILAAFHEEVVCRGYLLVNFIEKGRPALGVIVTSVLFWIVHAMNPGAWTSAVIGLNLFLAGVLLALVFMWTENLWIATVVHFAVNAAQGLIFGLPISGLVGIYGVADFDPIDVPNTALTGGDFGVEGSVIMALLQIIVVVILAIKVRAKLREDGWTLADKPPEVIPPTPPPLPTAGKAAEESPSSAGTDPRQ
jgi:membrane protease YdiL (CAAX protease family)